MTITILILKSLITGYFLNRFEPINFVLNLLKDNILTLFIKSIFECSKCTTFWASLIISQDFYIAAFSSFLMMIYEKSIGDNFERRFRI